jgi:serine/threonine protein phosphatase PrpC
VVALLSGAELLVANAGDSRCVASRRGAAVAMTTDHKPTDAGENERIRKARAARPAGRPPASMLCSERRAALWHVPPRLAQTQPARGGRPA